MRVWLTGVVKKLSNIICQYIHFEMALRNVVVALQTDKPIGCDKTDEYVFILFFIVTHFPLFPFSASTCVFE